MQKQDTFTLAGHRSRLPKSLPLKRGMLHYAYSRKLPVQVTMYFAA